MAIEGIFRWIVRHRAVVLVVMGGLSVLFGYFAKGLIFASYPLDLFPTTHPYVKTFLEHREILGGPDSVLIVMSSTEKDIFNVSNLNKVARLTRALESLQGVHPFQVVSLASKKIKDLRFDEAGNFKREPVMWPRAPLTENECLLVRAKVLSTPGIIGRIVSADLKATMIQVGFLPSIADYSLIYSKLKPIVAQEEDSTTRFHLIGRPILVGQIREQSHELLPILGLSLGTVILLLAVYFRSPLGVAIPVISGLLSTIWGLGFVSISNINFDPLIMMVPLLLSTRSLSHSVQFVDRVTEEYSRTLSREMAIVTTCSRLFEPAFLSIFQDAASLMILLLVPIPLLQKLAILSGFWVLSILLVNFLALPALLCYLAPPKRLERSPSWATTIYNRTAVLLRSCYQGTSRNLVLGSTALAAAASITLLPYQEIGNPHPGSFLLWPEARYNRDTQAIGDKFKATDFMTIIVSPRQPTTFQDPELFQALEGLQRRLLELPSVVTTTSILDLAEVVNAIFHGGDPRWKVRPSTRKEAAFIIFSLFSSSEPGDLDAFISPDLKRGSIVVHLTDHAASTLRQVVKQVKQFASESVEFKLAGGPAGLLVAIDETIEYFQFWIVLWALVIAYLFALGIYRCWRAALAVTIPMLTLNIWADGLMVMRGIGLNVNTLPVIALGVGLGVDYGIYVLSRIKEEFPRSQNLGEALLRTLLTTGRAVTLTALTMILSCVFWYWSFLRFQAEMGFLLSFWILLSWLSGVILVPALVAILKPKFLTQPSSI